MIVANQALTTSKLQMVSELLNDDQNADIRSQIFSTYLEDSHAGADKIIEFANKNGIDKLVRSEVIAYIDEMDEDEFDVELSVENLASIAGGGDKCVECQEEAHDEPWGRCPGMRPMRKWLFGQVV